MFIAENDEDKMKGICLLEKADNQSKGFT